MQKEQRHTGEKYCYNMGDFFLADEHGHQLNKNMELLSR